MQPLETIIREYKTARSNRNAASARNDLGAVQLYNDDLTYWRDRLGETITAEHVDIETVRDLLK